MEISAPLSRVWQALTDHEQFGEWFCVKVEEPFVKGQVAKGKLTYPGYENLSWNVMVQEINPQSLFSFTWHPYAVDPNIDYSSETPTLVEFFLEESGATTKVTVTESGFEKIPEHRRAEAFKMNTGGWEEQVNNIKDYVCDHEAVSK